MAILAIGMLILCGVLAGAGLILPAIGVALAGIFLAANRLRRYQPEALEAVGIETDRRGQNRAFGCTMFLAVIAGVVLAGLAIAALQGGL